MFDIWAGCLLSYICRQSCLFKLRNSNVSCVGCDFMVHISLLQCESRYLFGTTQFEQTILSGILRRSCKSTTLSLSLYSVCVWVKRAGSGHSLQPHRHQRGFLKTAILPVKSDKLSNSTAAARAKGSPKSQRCEHPQPIVAVGRVW